jgi:murein L,D-transpeptidase YcbB/YkuD
VEAALSQRPAADHIRAFYDARDYRPLWVDGGRLRPEAAIILAMAEGASADGLTSPAYHPAAVRNVVTEARDGDRTALARAELVLSAAYAAYVSDLHRPPGGSRPAFVDPALRSPEIGPRDALEALAKAPELSEHIAQARRMHPIYEELRGQLQVIRAAKGPADPLEPLILANMARARALPADPGRRYILVDAAAQRLWLYEGGRPVDSMKVIVGTPSAQTPVMAGLMRYANFRPYWNIPPDIVRDEIAPHVLREGVGYLERQEMEILSDWTPAARLVDPEQVDWAAVRSGAVTLRVRRRPGAYNILGQVKLMLPNPLGIYLHDTPNKQPFGAERRLLSHGCVRLEDAQRLARRLLGPVADNPPAGDDARVDLPEPIPVYIVYFTLAPGPDGLERRPDVYGRDPPVRAELASPPAG